MSQWLMTPLGPIVARDGRPFGANSGNRVKLTPWLYPSMTTGSFRTMLGKRAKEGFTPDVVQRLKETAVAGPLLYRDAVRENGGGGRTGELYFPAPRDIVAGEGGTWLPLRPVIYRPGEGTDVPGELAPVTLSDSVGEDFKPPEAPPWWSASQMTTWLLDQTPVSRGNTANEWAKHGFLAGPETERRTHVALDDDRGAGKEGQLYQTAGYQFAEGTRLAVRVTGGDEASAPDEIHPLGGERRLAAWHRTGGGTEWACPAAIRSEVGVARRLRMVLATPAVFSGGWKAGWLGPGMRGVIPGTDTAVRLVAACLDRWKPVSGWSLEANRRGEKPISRVVPAGSVYFFEREGEGDFDIESAWLQPVSDDRQLCLDGFGIAMWGKWQAEGEKE